MISSHHLVLSSVYAGSYKSLAVSRYELCLAVLALMPVKDHLTVAARQNGKQKVCIEARVCSFMHIRLSRKLLSGRNCIAKEPWNLLDPDDGP